MSRKPRNYFNFLTIMEEIESVGAVSPRDFQLKANAAYNTAQRLKLLPKIYKHFGWIKYQTRLRTKETVLYVYEKDSYVYVGVTNDPEMRHIEHQTRTTIPKLREMARGNPPRYFSRHIEYNDTTPPYVIQCRKIAERFERIAILKAVKSGKRVLNRQHNPQWNDKKYTWELDKETIHENTN